jgi:AcrR family transcriptional regulator
VPSIPASKGGLCVSRERKKNELTQDIIETAKRLFTTYGIEEVSMHMIAQELNIGQGTLYRRFSNKGDLCFTILRTDFENLHHKVSHYLKDNKHSRYEKGTFVIKELIKMNENHYDWFEVILSQTNFRSIHQEEFDKTPRPFLVLQKMIEPLFETTDMPTDPFFLNMVAAWCLNPILIRTFKEKGYSTEQIVEQFGQLFFLD